MSGDEAYENAASPAQQSDHNAELALLAACFHSRTARQRARLHLSGSDFWQPVHEALWDLMMGLDKAGRNVDAVTLQAAAGGDQRLNMILLEVATHHGLPDNVDEYARIIRGWSVRRSIAEATRGLLQRSLDPLANPTGLAAKAVQVFSGIRDASDMDALSSVLSLRELMNVADDTPEWVIPGLLERGDRLMLTGTEGVGKSAFARQLAIMAAAGIHPLTEGIMPPIKVAYFDCENKAPQIKRQTRPLLNWIHDHGVGASDPMDRVMIDPCGRIDITRDRDLSRVHQLLDAQQPDLVVIGPVYRLVAGSINTDDEVAPLLSALDTIMERGCAMILEAHAGHGKTEGNRGARDLRPRGSSALLGWPEFGLGLRGLGQGIADLAPWRGGREQRDWPTRMRRVPGHRWIEDFDPRS